ncbi:hypothetical protein SAMN05216275_10550 [Streptosporangium canum]|uniref:Uncharacterized protein n=1 Tax=Streptosporangium canum TaxID=324952 RepID=A0A1I3L8J8_9ACTN|nr:hypothetical protein [Streptosporangium canum]SFI81051.1 hypothetical protein SAMN05216275_10550 [Streptosporangium canum]
MELTYDQKISLGIAVKRRVEYLSDLTRRFREQNHEDEYIQSELAIALELSAALNRTAAVTFATYPF